VTADDAAANNGLNNASYRQVTVGSSPFNLTFSGSTVREKTALYAWQVQDPAVGIANADFVTTGSNIVERFEVGRRVTDLANGLWHYEYAVRNMNSDRAARALSVAFPPGATISNADLHVIDHHSGEIYTTEGWQVDTSAGNAVVWFNDNNSDNANVLRWGTAFSFWFDADQPPDSDATTITLFKPGTPGIVVVPFPELFANGFEAGTTSAWSGAS
jgi:hypothetical protein